MPRKYEFGLTPWGAYFIQAMEGLADQARLNRGRSYAANGNVLKLTIQDGVALAMVEGNYQPWYDVKIAFKPLTTSEKAALFYEHARKYLPFLKPENVHPDMAGIRPKLQGPNDAFADFVIREEAPGFINLVGIESPGLTA